MSEKIRTRKAPAAGGRTRRGRAATTVAATKRAGLKGPGSTKAAKVKAALRQGTAADTAASAVGVVVEEADAAAGEAAQAASAPTGSAAAEAPSSDLATSTAGREEGAASETPADASAGSNEVRPAVGATDEDASGEMHAEPKGKKPADRKSTTTSASSSRGASATRATEAKAQSPRAASRRTKDPEAAPGKVSARPARSAKPKAGASSKTDRRAGRTGRPLQGVAREIDMTAEASPAAPRRGTKALSDKAPATLLETDEALTPAAAPQAAPMPPAAAIPGVGTFADSVSAVGLASAALPGSGLMPGPSSPATTALLPDPKALIEEMAEIGKIGLNANIEAARAIAAARTPGELLEGQAKGARIMADAWMRQSARLSGFWLRMMRGAR